MWWHAAITKMCPCHWLKDIHILVYEKKKNHQDLEKNSIINLIYTVLLYGYTVSILWIVW
jgi:hypothetical protein